MIKFRDLENGEIFLFWERGRHLTALKIDKRQVFIFKDKRFVCIHHNKNVEMPIPLEPGFEVVIMKNGQQVLVKKFPNRQCVVKSFVVVDTSIVTEHGVYQKQPQEQQPDEEGQNQISQASVSSANLMINESERHSSRTRTVLGSLKIFAELETPGDFLPETS